MKKKILLSLIIAAISVFALCMISVSAANYGDLYYEISDGEVMITGCNQDVTSVVVPETIAGYPVTRIATSAFSHCKNLTDVTLPDGIQNISGLAFASCENLKSINIPDSVTSIDLWAFIWCSSLENITLPEGLSIISIGAFNGSGLQSINIPSSVVVIGEAAFNACESLKSINVDSNNEFFCSVDGNLFTKDKTELVQYAIGNSRTSYLLPDSVTSIQPMAFARCENLKKIEIGNNNIAYCSVDGNLLTIDKTELVQYAIGNPRTTYLVPDGVTNIAKGAFASCKNLIAVALPTSVKSIGGSAFSSCDNLETKYYGGTAVDYRVISIEDGNDCYKNASLIYSDDLSVFADNGAMIEWSSPIVIIGAIAVGVILVAVILIIRKKRCHL